MGLSLRLEVEYRTPITSIPRSLGYFGIGLYSDGLWSSMMPRRGPADVYRNLLAEARIRLLLAIAPRWVDYRHRMPLLVGPTTATIDLDDTDAYSTSTHDSMPGLVDANDTGDDTACYIFDQDDY